MHSFQSEYTYISICPRSYQSWRSHINIQLQKNLFFQVHASFSKRFLITVADITINPTKCLNFVHSGSRFNAVFATFYAFNVQYQNEFHFEIEISISIQQAISHKKVNNFIYQICVPIIFLMFLFHFKYLDFHSHKHIRGTICKLDIF